MRLIDLTTTLRSGWARLSVVGMLALFAVFAAFAKYTVRVQEVCYRCVSV